MAEDAYLENAYALIIGISKYKDPNIPKLNYTRADAEGLCKLLTDPRKVGLRQDKIKVLLDDDATRFNIKNAIISWLFKNADEESVVFIFFAGHGGVEEDHLGIEKDKLAKYLLPFDAVFDDLYSSALSNRDFNELLLSIKSRKLVIFMDSCYSGGVSERKARDVKITEDPYQKLAEGEGRLVIAASHPDQRSFEDKNLGHGIFTHHLIEALSGVADSDNDGCVTAMEMYKYLSETVPKTAKRLAGGVQEPILRGDLKTDFVLAVNHERLEEINRENIKKKNLDRLFEWYSDGELSPEQYDSACRLIKSSPENLSTNDKKILKLLNDLMSDKISISTFKDGIERIIVLEKPFPKKPEPDEKAKKSEIRKGDDERLRKEKEEQERLRREEEERKAREESDREAREEAERKDREGQEEERLRRQNEEDDRIAREREELRAGKEEGTSHKKFFVVALVLGVLLLGYWILLPNTNNVTETKISTSEMKLPSFAYTNPTVLKAYRYATEHPEILEQISCYCGCGEHSGHRFLRDCFIHDDWTYDDHASFCDVCIGEAIKVQDYLASGKTLKEARVLIDEEYSKKGGNKTNTPPVGDYYTPILSLKAAGTPTAMAANQFDTSMYLLSYNFKSLADGLKLTPAGAARAYFANNKLLTGTELEGEYVRNDTFYGKKIIGMYSADFSLTSWIELHDLGYDSTKDTALKEHWEQGMKNIINTRPLIYGHSENVDNVMRLMNNPSSMVNSYNTYEPLLDAVDYQIAGVASVMILQNNKFSDMNYWSITPVNGRFELIEAYKVRDNKSVPVAFNRYNPQMMKGSILIVKVTGDLMNIKAEKNTIEQIGNS